MDPAPAVRPFELPPAAWARLRALLDEALALAPERRAAWLQTLEPGDEALRPQLRRLLEQAPEAAAALDAGPGVETADLAGPAPAPPPQVGPYRLLHELGSGGMASVWLAERTDLLQSRRVALKLPHGAWRQAGLAERLQREREILATLEHPNIARLYDAGVDGEGRPYLALEYVQGEPIDAWCRSRAPATAARVALCLQAARAVAYAHARLVVHRDLKPAHILVSADAQVKLLDFGIARLLDQGPAEATELTRQHGRALTLRYAAPEQLLGQPVGTAADVHALGLLLYEVLSGERPYRLERETAAALEEAVLHQEPVAPSRAAPPALRSALRGDLDTIVLKCLKKDPAQRYATADALAEDLQRHLEQRPVTARPDSAGYRLGRWVRRHRLAAAASAAVVLALAGGGTAALWQAQIARAEADRARLALRVASAQSMLADFLASDLASRRSSTELGAQMSRAAEMVRREYAQQPLERAHLMADLAGRQRRIGDFAAFRTLAAEAEAAASQAGDAGLGARLACQRARDQAQGGDLDGARRLIRSTLAVLEARREAADATLVLCLTDASAVARSAGDSAEAIRSAERIRALEQGTAAAHSGTHGDTLMILGRAYALGGRFADALRVLDEAVALHERSGNGASQAMLNARSIRGTVLRDGGQPARGLAVFDEVLARHAATGGDAQTLAAVHYDRAMALLALGRAEEAAATLEGALAGARERGDRSLVRASATALAVAQAQAGAGARAEAALAESMSLYAQPLAQRSFTARLPLFAAAEVALASGRPERAREALDQAAGLLRQRRGGADADDPAARTLLLLRARTALAEARLEDAARDALRALALARRHAIDERASVPVGEALLVLAAIRRAQGDEAAARDLQQEARRHAAA